MRREIDGASIIFAPTVMTKPKITQHEYIQKVAALLKQQDYYKWDMSVIPAPPGTLGITANGIDVTGDLPGHKLVELEKLVLAEFDYKFVPRS